MQNNHSVSPRLMYCWEFLCQCGSTSTAVHTLSYRYRNNVSYSHHPIPHRPPAPAPLSPHQTCHHESTCQCSKHPLMMNKTKGEDLKTTKQSSKSYSSWLASARATFRAVTWKQAALYHPHGLPGPLTLHLLKGDSRTASVPLCLLSIVLKIQSVLYVYKEILCQMNTFL